MSCSKPANPVNNASIASVASSRISPLAHHQYVAGVTRQPGLACSRSLTLPTAFSRFGGHN